MRHPRGVVRATAPGRQGPAHYEIPAPRRGPSVVCISGNAVTGGGSLPGNQSPAVACCSGPRWGPIPRSPEGGLVSSFRQAASHRSVARCCGPRLGGLSVNGRPAVACPDNACLCPDWASCVAQPVRQWPAKLAANVQRQDKGFWTLGCARLDIVARSLPLVGTSWSVSQWGCVSGSGGCCAGHVETSCS